MSDQRCPRCNTRLLLEVDQYYFENWRCVYHGEVTLHPSTAVLPESGQHPKMTRWQPAAAETRRE